MHQTRANAEYFLMKCKTFFKIVLAGYKRTSAAADVVIKYKKISAILPADGSLALCLATDRCSLAGLVPRPVVFSLLQAWEEEH